MAHSMLHLVLLFIHKIIFTGIHELISFDAIDEKVSKESGLKQFPVRYELYYIQYFQGRIPTSSILKGWQALK
jgi:hypothetical protein